MSGSRTTHTGDMASDVKGRSPSAPVTRPAQNDKSGKRVERIRTKDDIKETGVYFNGALLRFEAWSVSGDTKKLVGWIGMEACVADPDRKKYWDRYVWDEYLVIGKTTPKSLLEKVLNDNPAPGQGPGTVRQNTGAGMGDSVILYPDHRLNEIEGEKLEGMCDSFLKKGFRKIIIDLSEAGLINSIGVSILVGLIEKIREGNGSLALAGIRSADRGVFDVAGLTGHVQMFDTVVEAVDSAGGTGNGLYTQSLGPVGWPCPQILSEGTGSLNFPGSKGTRAKTPGRPYDLKAQKKYGTGLRWPRI